MVVPSDYVQKVGADEFLRRPVGSGPYKFEGAKQGQFVDLSVFDHYAFDPPGHYRKVHLAVLPEGATRIAQLRAGDIDFAIDVDISQIASLKAEGFNVVTNPSGQVLSIVFNSRPGLFGDPRIGRAFNMAVDKNAIVKSIYLDRASVMSSNDPTIRPDDVPPITYDPEGAKRLLQDAKFDFNRNVKLDYPAGRYPRDQLLVQAIQAYLGAIGVKVELRPVDGATWLKGLREKTLHDMTLTLNSNVNYDSYQSLWSGSSSKGPWSLWTNPEFDSALNSIASTTGQARRAAFINLAKETQKNPQAIYLLDFHQVYAMRQGIAWAPTPGIRNFDFTTIRPE